MCGGYASDVVPDALPPGADHHDAQLGFAGLALTTLAGSRRALAQSLQTGNHRQGQRQHGGAAPGVTVTLTSPVLITPRTPATDEEGTYRFTALPPGTYALAFELKGFRKLTRSNIPVTWRPRSTSTPPSRSVLERDGRVVAGSSLVDVTQTNVATNLDTNALQGIPTARDVWAILQNMAPQVVLDREDVGGSQGGLQAVFSIHGSTWHQNTYAMNGVNVTDPAATGAAGFYYDYDSFEEVHISTAQHAAEVGTPGVYYNFVAKRGTDAFHGGAAYYFENSGLVSDNVTQELQDQGITSGAGIDLFSDATVQLGGPLIKDKLRFYTSWRDWRIHRNVPNFPRRSSRRTPDLLLGRPARAREPQLSAELRTTASTPSGRARPTGSRTATPAPRSSPTAPGSRMTCSRSTRRTTTRRSRPTRSSTSRVSYSNVSFPLFQDGVTRQNTPELTTGNQTGAAPPRPTSSTARGWRARARSPTSRDGWPGADHDFKAGYEFYRGYSREPRRPSRRRQPPTPSTAQPSTVTRTTRRSPASRQFKGSVLFVQDSITKDRLAINLGLRFEHTNGFLPAQIKPGRPVLARPTFAGRTSSSGTTWRRGSASSTTSPATTRRASRPATADTTTRSAPT